MVTTFLILTAIAVAAMLAIGTRFDKAPENPAVTLARITAECDRAKAAPWQGPLVIADPNAVELDHSLTRCCALHAPR